MTTAHGVFLSKFAQNNFKSGSLTAPWFGEYPLGHWDKDGELIEFTVLANLVSGGGIHIGASKAKALGVEGGTQSIVPLKERKINVQTGEKYSAWKYVKSVQFNGVFNEAEGDDKYANLIKKFGLEVENFASDLEAFSTLYFYFLDRMGCDKPLKLESFIAEVAAAYALLRHGIRVPAEYLPAQRLQDWASIIRGGEDKTLTIIGTRAESLIR